MTRPTGECTVEGCERQMHRRGLCARHYKAALAESPNRVRAPRATPPRKPRPPIPPVVADVAWPDTHPGAPGGQRLVLYTCPACGLQHLVSWLPFDEHPGLKMTTCREKSAAQNAPIPQFYVLRPPDEAILAEKPTEAGDRDSVKRVPDEPGVSKSPAVRVA